MLKRMSVLALMASVAVVAGCGQKGPLYLPPPAIEDSSKPVSESSNKSDVNGSEANAQETVTPITEKEKND